MDNIVEFIDKHKGGILITIALHFVVIIYINFSTFDEKLELESWSFKGKEIETDDIEITKDQIETPQEMQLYQTQDILNAAKDVNNTQEAVDQEEYLMPNEDFSTQSAQDYENSIKDQLAENRAAQESTDSDTQNNDPLQDPKTKPNDKGDNGDTGNNAPPVKGKTMIEYNLAERTARKLRNPGYTCGNENGKVVVRIKVSPDGVVLSSKYAPELSVGATECMIQKGESYALKSKFNYDPSAAKSQSGTITYIFIYKK